MRVSSSYKDKKTDKMENGSKTFFVQVDVLMDFSTKTYKTKKAKIGLYGEYTPDDDRKKAPEIIKKLREGKSVTPEVDPTLHDLYERFIKDKAIAQGTLYQYRIHIPGIF